MLSDSGEVPGINKVMWLFQLQERQEEKRASAAQDSELKAMTGKATGLCPFCRHPLDCGGSIEHLRFAGELAALSVSVARVCASAITLWKHCLSRGEKVATLKP